MGHSRCNIQKKVEHDNHGCFDRIDGSLMTDPRYSFPTACSFFLASFQETFDVVSENLPMLTFLESIYPCQTMDGHTNAVICILVVNRLMYSGSADGSAKCWVTEFGDCTRQYKSHKGSVIAMKFHAGICKLCFSCMLPFTLCVTAFHPSFLANQI